MWESSTSRIVTNFKMVRFKVRDHCLTIESMAVVDVCV